MSLLKFYDSKIIEYDLFQTELECRDLQNKKTIFEDKFKSTDIYNKFIYVQDPKYYMQNKKKVSTESIQEGLRSEVDKLNHLYADNKYVIDIHKVISEKKENKHIYNIYNISILEYKKMNVFEDIILESNMFSQGDMKPLSFSNINTELTVKLYDMIDDTLNLCEIYTDMDVSHDVKYHNRYISYVRKMIYGYFLDMFSKHDSKVSKLRKLLGIIDINSSSSMYIELENFLTSYYKKSHFDDEVEQIVELILELGWNIDIGVLNYDLLLEDLDSYEII